MKRNFYFIVLLLVGSFLSSCENNELDHQNNFDTSRNAWLDFKKSTDNSYKYTAIGGSWAGSSWETMITVSNGKIIERHFKYTVTDGLAENIPDEDLEWTEHETEIGNHDYSSAADPLTLDDIYDKAQQDWLVKREDVQTILETKNNALISTCGYVENGCMDDCFIGIHIKSIEKL